MPDLGDSCVTVMYQLCDVIRGQRPRQYSYFSSVSSRIV